MTRLYVAAGPAAEQLDAAALKVLGCYLLHWLDNDSRPCAAPSSRLLRQRYAAASGLSRRDFATGVRQLLGRGLMTAGTDPQSHALYVLVPSNLDQLVRELP